MAIKLFAFIALAAAASNAHEADLTAALEVDGECRDSAASCGLSALQVKEQAMTAEEEDEAGIGAHVLDITLGKGAGGVIIDLDRQSGDGWKRISSQTTQDSGRTENFEGTTPLVEAGVYRLTFHVDDYFKRMGRETFYPEVVVHFRVKDFETKQNFHIPITLAEFGYSTYRGV